MKVKLSQVNSLTGTSPHGTGANTCTSVHETARHLLGQTCLTHARGTTRKHSFAAERLTSCAMGSGPRAASQGQGGEGGGRHGQEAGAATCPVPTAAQRALSWDPQLHSLSFWLHCRDSDPSLTSLCLSFLICVMGCPRTMPRVQILRDCIFFHPCLYLRPQGPHSCPDQAELGLKELSLGVLRGLRVWGQEEPQFNCY